VIHYVINVPKYGQCQVTKVVEIGESLVVSVQMSNVNKPSYNQCGVDECEWVRQFKCHVKR
jgi:hypothetical protein